MTGFLSSPPAMRVRRRLARVLENHVAPWIERTPVLNLLEKVWVQDHIGGEIQFGLTLELKPLELSVRFGRTTFGIGG